MKITTVGAGVSSSKFSSRVMKLCFVFTSTGNTSAAVLSSLGNSTIEVTSQHPSYATKTRLYKNPVLDLLEIAACNEGAIVIDGSSGSWKVRASVELSDDGAIVPLDNEQFAINLELASGLSADIFALDVHEDAVTEIEYKPVPCFGLTPTPINVVSAKWLAIPKATLQKVEFEMPNGQRIEYSPDELQQMVSEGNEQALIVNGAVTPGSINLYIMNVSHVKTAHVTTNSQANVYVVNEKQIF